MKEPTIIEVPTTSRQKERYERSLVAKDVFNLLDKKFITKVNKDLSKKIKNSYPHIKDFTITKELVKGKGMTHPTLIIFHYQIDNLPKEKCRTLSFKGYIEESASHKTRLFELIPFLFATDRIRIVDGKYEYISGGKNKFLDREFPISAQMGTIREFNTSLPEQVKANFIKQGAAIRDKLFAQISDIDYIITSGNFALGREIKNKGIELTKKEFKKNVQADNFAKFDILLVKRGMEKYHTKSANIQALLNSFAPSTKAFNNNENIKYLGISIKKDKGSQAGKCKVFLTSFLK